MEPLGFAGRAIGELRIGMHAGAGRVAPGPHAVLPGRDDPAIAGRIAARDERIAKQLIVVA